MPDTQRDPFIMPTMPDVAPILNLHRGSDGYVTIHRKDESGAFRDLAAVPAAEMDNYFPGFLEEIDKDSFYSVNAYYKGIGKSEINPNLPRPFRQKKALRWLTACFSDLDVGRPGRISIGQALGFVVDLQDAGAIPPVSMFVRSGRGLWLFWVLRNDNEAHGPLNGPARAWPESVGVYTKIQKHIAGMLARVEADLGAIDPVRVTRIPGSLHSGSGTRVSYWIQADAMLRGYTYTLSQLCQHFKIEDRKLNPIVRREVDPAVSAQKRGGFIARWQKGLNEFLMLWAIRGGFREGHRFNAARLYASILTTLGKSKEEIAECLMDLASKCLSADGLTPAPLEKKDCLDALRMSYKISNLSWQDIANILTITPAEADHLEGFPAAAKFNHQPIRTTRGDQDLKPSRQEQADRRRRLIIELVKTSKDFPTIREIQKYIGGITYQHYSTRTIQNDLDALDFNNPRKRHKQTAAADLFDDLGE